MLNATSITQHRYRLILLGVGLLACIFASYLILAPSTKAKPGSDYKFMHCKVCKTERNYEKSFAETKCMKCLEQKKSGGPFVPTLTSVKDSSANIWKSFIVAVAIEIIAFLGLLVYFLQERKDEEKVNHLYCNCPKCKWRLRFKETSAGKMGQCPRCKKPFQFPQAESADTKEFPAFQQHADKWPQETHEV